ncbi:MAG: beta-N-acetylhexosaminidase [Proteobacteria bacterium]|nr:beta-N-acetylhexosaminidase [Pseudomonadota bacterium]
MGNWTPRGASAADLAGQRLMIGISGPDADEETLRVLTECRVGSVVLFARNITEPDRLRALIADLQACAAGAGLPPLFVAVDQEGGTVARLKPPFAQFPGNPGIRTPGEADAFARDCAADLLWAGFNMDLAPVMDLALIPDSVMEKRAFGADPKEAARLGALVIAGLQDRGIMAVAKHFPGIGRTTLDSHKDLPFCPVSVGELAATDLVPFAGALGAGVGGVMMAHVVYPELDPDWPASLSPAVARDLLRGRMGFSGLVLGDDLDMGAIARHFDLETAVDRSLDADVDQVLICHPGPNIPAAFERMVRRMEEDPELKRRGVESAERILAAKKRFAVRET